MNGALLSPHNRRLSVLLLPGFAGHAREVVLAVNPLDLQLLISSSLASLFPNYTSWSMHTWVATLVWLVVLGTAVTNQNTPLAG